jgi:tetratricopeptide (TPR) repeat protein
MPDARSRPHSIRLAVPAWLAKSVTPWRIDGASLWHSSESAPGAVELQLRSERASIPVLVELPEPGARLRLSIRDRRIPAQRGASFVQALAASLERAPELRRWLGRLSELAKRLSDPSGTRDGSAELERLLALWRQWPQREPERGRALPKLAGEASEFPRAVRASLVLHRLAGGDVLGALTEWSMLQTSPTPSPSFVERHVDAVALGLLGRRSEALAALSLSDHAGEPERCLATARAYEALEARGAAIAAHEQVVALRGDAWDHLRLARAGRAIGARDVPRLEPSASNEERITYARSLVKVFDAAGRFDEASIVLDELFDTLDERPADLVLRAATLHLWRREDARARARLAELHDANDEPKARLIEGALAVLEGRPRDALECFESLASDRGTRLERLLWQAEAWLALDDTDAALVCVDEHIKLENSLCAYLLKLLIVARTRAPAALADSLASRTFLDALVPDVLPSLCAAERLASAHENPSEFAGLIRETLDAMGGNRGPTPTWLRRDHDGGARLERVEVRVSGRDAAVANLVRIRTEPPEVVLAGFDVVAAEYPSSPHPYTYRGELQIWLGRYHDALASFAEADARAPTRWSFVGRAAAYDLLGESEQADHWTREGAARFGELETATTHVYRGERLRKLGAWAEARRDLETAVAFKTRRIGARINLALVYRAQADETAWQREVDRLQVDAPALLWEVGIRSGQLGQRIDPDVLLSCLAAMSGNRSSFLHSIVDADGRFRVLPEPDRWIAHARLCLGLGRDAIERELVASWLGQSAMTNE